MVKVAFSGNLNSKVDCCPPFPGRERHLLREQIARITHATTICPSGYFEFNEEAKKLQLPEEEPEQQNTQALTELENWQYRYPNILLSGRCTHQAPVGTPEDDVDGALE